MPNYKITFARNTILSCKVTNQKLPSDSGNHIYYHHDKKSKQLVFAIIYAKSEAEALNEAKKLIDDYLAGKLLNM